MQVDIQDLLNEDAKIAARNQISPPPSRMQELARLPQGVAAAINTGAARFGGNTLADLAPLVGGGPGASQMFRQVAQNAPQIFGMQNPNTAQNIIAGAAQYAPFAALAPAMGTSDALSAVTRNLLGPAAQQGAMVGGIAGASQNPQTPIQSGIQGAIGGGAIGAMPGIAGAIGSNVVKPLGELLGSAKNYLTGGNIQDAADGLYQNISKGMDKNDLNDQNINNIIGNYNVLKNKISSKYNTVNYIADDRGYAVNEPKPAAGIDVQQYPLKYLNNSGDTLNQLTSLKDNPNITSELSGNINNYLNKPTFNNAHNLQSLLGKESADLLSSLHVSPAERDTAKSLLSTRNNLKNDIIGTFNNNGDNDLANLYSSASQDWKNNVIPYQQVAPIWRAINNKGRPDNILNVLDDNKYGDANQAVRNDLLSNVDTKNSVMAQALNKTASKGDDNQYKVNFDKFIDTYNNLPDNLKQFSSGEFDNQMKNLSSQQQNLSKMKKYGGYALGLIGGGEALRHFL